MVDSQLVQDLVDLKEEETLNSVRRELEKKTDPVAILETCREAMIIVGKRFEEGEYFLPELIIAGEIFKEAAEILNPALENGKANMKGTVVFGTVRGDVHDIGKDIVVAILQAVGYEVHDLGVDTPPEKFIAALRETGAPVLGLSGLITTAYDGMKDTVAALVEEGLRDRVKVMIGGGVMNERVLAHTGADAYGNNPMEAVKICQRFMGGN